MSIYQKIQTRKFKVLGVYNYAYDTYQIIDIDDEKLPKKPIICRKCKSNQQHTLRPESFLLRKGNVYVLFTCSKCKQSIAKEYSLYARESLGVKNGLGHYIPPTDSGEKIIPAHKKVLDSTSHQRYIKNIKDILHLDSDEDAEKVSKKWEEQKKLDNKEYQAREKRRKADYEYNETNEKIARKSQERKELLEKGIIEYSKKNGVFYYVASGKVYS